MSLLDEYKQLQQQNSQQNSSAGSGQQQGGTQRKSLLQEYVDNNGTAGLNKSYVDSALRNGGGFGAIPGGIYQNEDGSRYIKPHTNRIVAEYQQRLIGIRSGLNKISAGNFAYGDPDIQGLDNAFEEIRRELASFRSRYVGFDYTEIDTLIQDVEEMYDEYISKAKAGWNAYEAYLTGNTTGSTLSMPKDPASAEGKERAATPWYLRILSDIGMSPDTTLPGAHITQAVEAYREDDTPTRPDDDWEDYQRNLYGYLYAADPERAGEYARYANESINQEALKEKTDAISDWATKNGWTATAATIASIAAMPLSLIDTMDYLAQMAGRGYATTIPVLTPGKFANTVRGAVSEDLNETYGTLNEAIPIIGGKGWGDAYQLGTSIADSMAAGYILGPVGTYVTFFGSASASGIENAKARGATDEQALWLGIAYGLAEAAGEAFSIDKLLKTGSSDTLKAFFFNILKQSGVEASEEGFTTLANNLADQLIMQDQSEFNSLVLYYTQNGMSEEEATKQAWKDMAESLAFDMLGGFVSGGVSSTIQTGTQNVVGNIDAKNTYGPVAAELVAEGLEIDPSNKLASKMQDALDRGKNVTGSQLRHLVEQNETAMRSQDRTSIQEAAAARLTALGEAGDVQTIARALTKQATGERLSRAEQQAISGSKYGQRVANEMSPENIRSGGYASGWAESIGTNRLNAEEYNRIVEAAQIREDAEDTTATTGQSLSQPAADSSLYTKEPLETQEPEETAQEGVAGAEAEQIAEEEGPVHDAETAKALVMDMAQSGADLLEHAKSSGAAAYLSAEEIEAAYKAGQKASAETAAARATSIQQSANGKTGRKRGVVRGDGVTITDLNEYAKSNFNTTQRSAYKILDTFAEATGIDIVLYKSSANEQGEYQGAQGKFKWSEGTIYIDINSGLKNISGADSLGKYTMLRTFSHEFVHFIEKYNAVQYNEFRTFVFSKLAERGENVADLIEEKIAKAGRDENGKPMSYDMSSREVVAEAMTDILPDSSFVQELAEKHKNVFETLLEKLKDFVSKLREHFNSLANNPSREANALKEEIEGSMHYMEGIAKMFDKIAVQAVENYQSTVATEETVVAKEVAKEEVVVSKMENTTAETTTVEAKAEPRTSTSENGYTITDNLDKNSIEIKFDSRPAKAILDVLKANKFRWHKDKGIWYGRATHEAIMEELDKAYEAERAATPAEEAVKLRTTVIDIQNGTVYDGGVQTVQDTGKTQEAPKAKTNPIEANIIKAAERAADPNDPYSRLEGVMNSSPRFYTGGFLFRIMKAGKDNAFWMGEFTSATKKDDFEIVNARGPKYSSELFESRKDAVADLIAVARNNRLLDNETQNNEEEVTENGENLDNSGAVRQPDSDRPGDTPVLEGVQTEDVQGDVQRGDPVGSAAERGSEAARDDVRDASAGDDGARGDGSDQSGDIRRADELSQEEAEAKAEELHETVTEQIEQQSTAEPKGRNFVIGESLNLPSGAKSRFRANVDAIRLIKNLNAEGRQATAAEQETLSRYVGWGGLSEAFGEMTWNRETRKSEMTAKPGWEKEFSELRQLVTEGIITEEEYQAASKSTQNAHYTSVEVIKAMYEGLAQLGFKGGRMLEPSSGVGNFVGAMPASMSAQVQSWTMVELDRITGQIAKYLYPQSDVRIQGFEKANIPDNYMDVAIGNVPFGNVGVVDKAYPKRITKAIHNYFFAKSLDKVRPGGIVMFITSSFTMNGTDTAVRQYIMDRADLLGAIRLPNNAFAGNAGTQVVTDILILKKRTAGTAYAGEAFLEAPYDRGAYMNEYFTNHPEMVLGTATYARGMYGANTLTYEPFTDRGSLGEQMGEAFKHIKGQMDYQTKRSPEKTNFAVERATKKTKNGGLVVNADGSISRNEDGELTPVKTNAKTAKRISGLLSIRDAYRRLASYLQQGQDAKYIAKARKELNEAYDKFVKEYGYINAPANRKAIAEDPDSFAIYALENYDAEKKAGTKADIFTKDTISPNRTISSVEDVASGLIVSINQTGGVDAELIAKLTGKTVETVSRELIDSRMAFKTRDGGFEARETYLSGNVRAKLRDAEALAPMDKDYENNVEELKKVIPADIPFHDISVTPGAPWIPTNVYADFIAEMLGGYNSESSYRGPDVVVGKSNQGDFKIVVNNARLKQNHLNTQKWGTKRRSFLELIEAMMASRSVTVKDNIEDPLTGKKLAVINKVETAAAQEKVEEITKEFQEWLWRDENRRAELTTLYNEVFNALVPPKYDGSNLTVNGQNPHFSLRAHQADAVQRIISSGGNTLLAHKVGAGKTLEMAAAAMKLRELGIVKKPLFVVPKSLVAQWGVEFMNYYPAARLLVSDENSFTPANRKTYANRIANGDYDAVIVSYEQFEKIPMSADFQREFYQEQIGEILDAIAEERAETKGKGITVKEMEKKRAQLEKKIAELTTKAKDEGNIDFEQLGVDSIFVDEAHNFKNLQYVSRMNNISGLGNKDGVQRAFDLYTKVRYLQKLNGGRGIVFATATPVMNSMAEMYIMQKYLQSDMLDKLGLKSFDAWAKQFGEVVNSVEIKPSGQGFRVKQTFSNFRNLNELQLLFRSFSDVLTTVPGLKIPKMKGGKVNVVVCEPGQFQKDYMAELEKRADSVKNVDPSVDNMLKITSDGRKVSYTQRMIDPTLPYEPGCKIYRCCENVLAEYKDSKKIKGTQIIFCDMATPKGKSKTANATENADDTEFDVESAKLYDDMRDYLVKKGIPAKEIAFIHEADTDQKKKKLFADVNEGKVRVLIGSTGKMGVGMNAQKRIVAIHHLDAPWRPGDVEQRDGRAFRQGNINDEVSKYTYVTEGSFDARLWDILDRKQHFINQIMNGEDVGRSAEDTGDVTLSAAEVKALASGNPLIEEHVKLTTELQKLENLKLAHNSNITRAKARLAEDEKNIASLTSIVANLKEDLKTRVDTYSEGKFSMTIGKQKFTDKKEAGIALVAAVNAKGTEDGFATIGKFAGFELRVIKQGHEYKGMLFGKQGYGFNVYESNTTYGINHLIAIAEGLDGRLVENQERLKELTVDREAQREIIAQPFTKQAELDKKRARFNEIMEILNPKEEQTIAEEELEQHQSREYLSDEAESFRADIDTWDKGGRPAGETFILGSTGNVFQGLGAIESDVYMLSDKINTIFKDHPEMTIKEIKNLPEILENPVMVLASRNLGRGTRNNTRLTVFGMVKAQNGLPVMVAFDLHPVENNLYLADMQKVVSAYTKDGSPTAAMSLMKNSDVLYADKDKTASLLHTVGFHNAYRIEQSGYVGNISYEDDQVKVSGKKFSDVFTEEIEQHQSRGYLDEENITDSPVSQAISSAKTSIKQIPALFKDKNVRFGKTNVDIGGGRFDLATEFLAEQGTKNYLFDPYNRPENVNMATLKFLQDGNRADTATCANVLNVIAEPAARANVILEAAKAIKQEGTAYFMVYEGDGSGVGRETSSGWQNNRKTADYVGEIAQYFNSVVRKGKLIIATDPVENLPKAAWEITPGNAIQYQQRIEPLTDREVLALAASELGSQLDRLSDAEKDALNIFNKRLSKLEELEAKRAEEGRLYKEQQFGTNVDREAAKATLNRMHVLDSQIKKASEDVLNVENKAVLKSLLQKARKVVEQQERERGQEILKRWRARRNDAAAIKKYRDRLRSDVDELTNWILHPNNKDAVKHVPDALKNSVIPFLSSINFMSKRQLKGGDPTQGDEAFLKHLNSLKGALKQNIDVDGLYSGYNDLPPNFMENLQTFIDTTQQLVKNNSGEFVINQMTGEELKELSKVVRALKKYIMQMNRFHMNAMYQHVYEAGDNSILHMGALGKAGKTGTVSNFVLWQNIRPAYAFERFGEGGMAIYDGLRRGQAALAFNTKKITEFANKTYRAGEVEAWEKEIKTFNLGGDTVKIPVSGIMSLYELQKRPQALTHILGGGIRVATYKSDGVKISDEGHTITPDELKKIVGSLSPRQMEVADKLQQFMAKQGGEWGNYVSVKRWGEEMFGEEHYFPINSDGRHLQATADEHPSAASLYALLNMSFTKELQENANNRVILYSIFDVFANHMASMAQYNALALPVLDSLKWFNYQQKSEPDENGKRVVLSSVREQMARAYGVPEETRPGSGRQGYAESFFMNIIKAFNGTEAQGVPTDTTGVTALRRYNMAQVAFNFRVVVQQPLSITRAALLVDYGSIIRGMKLKPSEIEKNIEEMQKYSGIAAWKSLGFYDINISRGLTDIIKHNTTWRDKVSDVGMWGAEKADLMTWAGIWSAAKEEVARKQRLTPKDEGYYEAVTKLFEDIIYKTQVVDSVLTKNEYLRSKGFFARAIGSFMSEPTTTISMLVDAFDKYSLDMQRGFTRQQAWKRNGEYITRVAYVYGIGAALLAAVQAVADAMRDDDDYQSFLEKWLEAFGGNLIDELMPFNKLPILSDFYDAAKEMLSIFGVDTYGTPPQSVLMQWWDSLVNGVQILHDKITGKETAYTWYGGAYKLLQAVSGISGLPIAAAVREINTAWNNTVGALAPSLKVKSYEPSDKNQIKYAYQDGWLDEEEATSLLLENGIVTDADDAYWTVQQWQHSKTDSEWSRYDAVYDAILAGDRKAFTAAQEALGDHGISRSTVRNEAKNQIKRWYQAEEQQMDRKTAIQALQTYAGMSKMEAEHEVDRWSAKVVLGVDYEDISEEFIKGNITAYRAEEMLIKYGHVYARDAAERVKEWQMEKDTGISYSKLSDAFIHDDVSESQAIDYLMKYGQLSREEAEQKVLDWQAAKDYGVTLGSTTEGIKKALIEGYISAETARTIMMVYDGKTAEEAEDYVNQYLFTAETGYSFSEIEEAYADGVITKAQLERWYRDASLYTHGSEEVASEYAEVADWKAFVPYGDSMNRDGLEKWNNYGYHVTNAGLGKADFARAWGLYNAAESQYDSQGNKTKEKAQVFFEGLYDLYLQGVYTISEIDAIGLAVYSQKYNRLYKVW